MVVEGYWYDVNICYFLTTGYQHNSNNPTQVVNDSTQAPAGLTFVMMHWTGSHALF